MATPFSKGPYAVVIGDVVRSRTHEDQRELIRLVATTLEWVNRRVGSAQALEMTVGDEFQGAYGDLGVALDAALLVRLRLAGICDLRFGLGWGEITAFDPDRAPMAQSGSAWWAAREALEEIVTRVRKRQWPNSVRTWLVGAPDPTQRLLNALLMCRDELLAKMDERDARIALGLFLNERQEDVANALGISQPSVARRQVENGANAIYRAHEALRGLVP